MSEKQRTKKRIQELLERLNGEFNNTVYEEVVHELVQFGGKAVPALILALSDNKADSMRMYASQTLKEIALTNPEKVLEAVPVLIEILEREELVSAHYYLAQLIYNSEEILSYIAQKSGFKNYKELIVAFHEGKKITISD